jgi:hypothetical protein
MMNEGGILLICTLIRLLRAEIYSERDSIHFVCGTQPICIVSPEISTNFPHISIHYLSVLFLFTFQSRTSLDVFIYCRFKPVQDKRLEITLNQNLIV